MSRYVSNTKSKTAPTPYCKVCQDSGKPENVYRSHFTRETRDPNSRVTCPTLLALECRYCYKNGHTVKYCEVLKRNQKEQKREDQAQARRVAKTEEEKGKSKSGKKSTNVFACLDSDSEDEEEEKPVAKEEFPTLCMPALARTQSVAVNYAAALAKPAAPKPVEIKPVEVKPAENKPVTTAKVAPWASESKAAKMNWAAWDSDSEEEEDDEASVEYDPYKPYAISFAEEEDETW